MSDIDPFALNILGVDNLVSSDTNKVDSGLPNDIEVGELIDEYTLDMSDDECLDLEKSWEQKNAPYEAKIKPKQDMNKKFYKGSQGSGNVPVSSNIIFESEETFIPQALAKNPEPVVWSDNTNEGKEASNDIKTMLQYHADTLALNRTLGVMLRHWSIYFIGIVKHGWDAKAEDITLNIRNPQNFILDPDGYIDVKGIYKGAFLGERIQSSASKLAELYPEHKAFIEKAVDSKMGTQVSRTEWWTDEYCFTTFKDKVLDKHKNEFFNYDTEEEGLNESDEDVMTTKIGRNHLAHPQMPYTFLSVYSLEEQPHDITNLVEQNIANQNRITERDLQIDKNLRAGNNSLVVDPTYANQETARQIAEGIEDGDPILVDPKGVMRLPASPLPSGILEAQNIAKDTLRSSFGVQGLSAQKQTADTTARGMILNQAHDATRIGGGIGDALEQVADSIFNFQLQMYYVFFDTDHYAAIMGAGRAVEYVKLNMSNMQRQFVVSVSPDSMKPKDEITEMNLAVDLWKAQALDPINLFKKLNYPDPLETAKQVSMWITNPQGYMMTYFPEQAPMQDSAPPMNPPDIGGDIQGAPNTTLGAPPASSALSQVSINQGASMPQ